MARLEELEHDGLEDIVEGLPTLHSVRQTVADNRTEEQKRIDQIRSNPSERRRSMLDSRNRPAEEPWLSVNNPLVWVGDPDDED